MLKLISESLKTQLKLVIRSRATWVLCLIWILLLAYNIFYLPKLNTIGDELALSGWVIQILVFVGLILGLQIGDQENQSVCEEIMFIIPKVYVSQWVSKLLLFLIISIGIIISSSLIYFTAFLFLHAASIYYFSTVSFIIVYWAMSFLISAYIGLLVGYNMKTKVKYGIIMILGIVLGPIFPMLLSPIFETSTVLYPYLTLFNLGTVETQTGMNILFGYEIYSVFWWTRLSYLLVCILLVVGNILSRNRYKLKWIVYAMALSFLFLGTYYHIKGMDGNFQKTIANNLSYVYGVEEKTVKSDSVPYRIESYDIKLNDRKLLHIVADIKVVSDAPVEEIELSLYHGFKINSCRINGKDVKFERTLDRLKINAKMEKGKPIVLRLDYEGVPIPTMYKDSSHWVLPGFFPWLPRIGTQEALQVRPGIFDINFIYEPVKVPIAYTLHFESKHKVYTNLEQISPGLWEGESGAGITIVNGWLTEYKGNKSSDRKLYYPSVFTNYEQPGQKMGNEIGRLQLLLRNDFPDVNVNKGDFKSIFFLPDLTFTGYGEKLFFLKDHLIVWVSRAYIDGEMLNNPNITIVPLMDLLLFKQGITKEEQYYSLFRTAYLESLNQRGLLKTDDEIRSLDRFSRIYLENTQDKVFSEICLSVKKFLAETDETHMRSFFNKFRNRLNQGNEIRPEEVLKWMED